jgi:hypothetical protein
MKPQSFAELFERAEEHEDYWVAGAILEFTEAVVREMERGVRRMFGGTPATDPPCKKAGPFGPISKEAGETPAVPGKAGEIERGGRIRPCDAFHSVAISSRLIRTESVSRSR